MCNHYANIPEIQQELATWREFIGCTLTLPLEAELAELEQEIWPRRRAAVVRSSRSENGTVADIMRWGIPLNLPGKRAGTSVTKYITNVRNLDSPFWRGMLNRPEQRCLVPFARFAEPKAGAGREEHWFTVMTQKTSAFAGIWRWTEGAATDEAARVFAFLTCAPNPLVAPRHPKAMPVILHPADYQSWLTADWRDAKNLVQPFPSQLMAVR